MYTGYYEDINRGLVDYIGLVKAPAARTKNEEVGIVSAGLKNLARTLEIPVIALCQINREIRNRGHKRPKLYDLKDSGSLEQDADIVAFIYRGHKFDDRIPENAAELIIEKHRNGPVGNIPLTWHDKTSSFKGI